MIDLDAEEKNATRILAVDEVNAMFSRLSPEEATFILADPSWYPDDTVTEAAATLAEFRLRAAATDPGGSELAEVRGSTDPV